MAVGYPVSKTNYNSIMVCFLPSSCAEIEIHSRGFHESGELLDRQSSIRYMAIGLVWGLKQAAILLYVRVWEVSKNK
jgi:hypothetical protein